MDIKNAVVTDIAEVFTVYSQRGRYERMQNREHYGLSLCLEGQITYIQDGVEYVSSTDTAVILPKGGNYFIRGDKTGYFPVINFECRDLLCDTVTVIPVQNAEQLISDYERMKKIFGFDGGCAQVFSIFYGMLHRLSSDSIPYELRGAVQIIKNEYNDVELTNARLASECNMSEVYFRKLFLRYFKTSPKQFIIDMRLQRAKQLLSEGALSISAISEACGFSNPYHFCRIFKQHTGVTPSEYRKENLVKKI